MRSSQGSSTGRRGVHRAQPVGDSEGGREGELAGIGVAAGEDEAGPVRREQEARCERSGDAPQVVIDAPQEVEVGDGTDKHE
jgi:hypothetical protein